MNIRENWIMDRKKGIGLCNCGMCPSFVDCKEEIAYCLAEKGTSGCINFEQGCLCPGCPVQIGGEFPACLLLYPGKRGRTVPCPVKPGSVRSAATYPVRRARPQNVRSAPAPAGSLLSFPKRKRFAMTGKSLMCC